MLIFIALIVGVTECFGFLGHRLSSYCICKQLSPEAQARLQADIVSKDDFLALGGWPDRIKRQEGWTWTKRLHFLDTDDDPPHTCHVPQLHELPYIKPNVITAAMNFTERFNQSKSREDLGFMMHFIMDLHQPLHLAKKARGGNDYKVNIPSQVKGLVLWGAGERAFALGFQNGQAHANSKGLQSLI